MNGKISVVINTLNEEEHLKRLLPTILWADEILVCDMHSDDNTAVIAKKHGAKVIFHKRLSFVEPARNFAISKTSNEWVLVLDPDEEVPEGLAEKLKEIVKSDGITTFVEIPRKNLIFNKWMKASMWWPDYHIRFFKRDSVIWSNKIHGKPKTEGQGLQLPAEERWALIHHHYTSIGQFIERMNRYTTVQAKELINEGYKFEWVDLIRKPLSEFLGRFFANKGYQDGLHGLSLGFLQAISFLVVYLKVWEAENFKESALNLGDLRNEFDESGKEITYWFKYGSLSNNPLKRFLQRAKNKLS